MTTARLLPIEAGPDYDAHHDAIRFYQTHRRLAVFPEDEDRVSYYSVYGGTRLLRPPFAYLFSALLAGQSQPPESYLRYRRGTALLGAATVVTIFFTVSLYFHSHFLGLVGALLTGLMPQFAFIASYANDDAGAIFSSSLVLLAVVRLYRRGATLANWAFLAAASGLVVLNKQTAWLMLPMVALFCALFVRFPLRRWPAYLGSAILLFFLCGGWWLAYNVHHYGPTDPFATGITRDLAARHTRFPPDKKLSFRDFGIGYRALLLHNHDNFWGKTFTSTYGNLDWLRLRVGPWQYGLYFTVTVLGFVYFLVNTFKGARLFFSGSEGQGTEIREYVMRSLLAGSVAMQFAMYVWTNVNNDIQMQGKYLLPAFPALLLLALSAVAAGREAAMRRWGDDKEATLRLPLSGLRAGFLTLTIIVLLGIHVDALLNYVIPFYRPVPFELDLRDFQRVPLNAATIIPDQSSETLQISFTDGGVTLTSRQKNPWLIWDAEAAGVCKALKGNLVLWFDIEADRPGNFKIYVDKGHGFREQDAYRRKYGTGRSDLFFAVAMPVCRPWRFEPLEGEGSVTIRALRFAPLRVLRRM